MCARVFVCVRASSVNVVARVRARIERCTHAVREREGERVRERER